MRKILIAGSNGLLGTALQHYILEHSPGLVNSIFCTRRINSDLSFTPSEYIDQTIVINNLNLATDWAYLLSTVRPDVIILISNIRHLNPLLYCLNDYSLRHYRPQLIIIGTTGVFSRYSHYSSEYQLIENTLQDYSGRHLLLRPSMIYGSPRDKNLHKVIAFIRKYHFYPIFGNGENLLQPVYYMDLVRAIHYALLNPCLSGNYNLPGKYPITYNSLVSSIFKQLCIKPRIIHIPLHVILLFFRSLPTFITSRLPFTEEQVIRLSEHKIFPYESSRADLAYSPHSFSDGLYKQLFL